MHGEMTTNTADTTELGQEWCKVLASLLLTTCRENENAKTHASSLVFTYSVCINMNVHLTSIQVQKRNGGLVAP